MLEGIRVIDFSQYLPGPYATLRLADLGAEVIKIEPLEGDPARHFGTNNEKAGHIFLANNRNKKSIAIHTKQAEGRDIALRLMETADVVVESFRPGVMKKLGLNYEVVKEKKPALIYCSLTGYGQTGRMHHLGSHDINYMSLCGVLSHLTDSTGRPIHPSITLADFIGGLTASEAILGALVQKGRTGKGAYLDISLVDTLISFMMTNRHIQSVTGHKTGIPLIDGTLISYSIYETKDQRYVSLAALEEKFWKNFCMAVEREEWILAQRSPTIQQNPVYLEVIDLFLSRTLDEWSRFSLEVDCCLTPILEVDELSLHPMIKDRGLYNPNDQNAPRIGAQTNEILSQLLQFSETKIEECRKNGIII